ncbi:hypothetical protein [Methanocalculus sp. MC3]
MTYRVACTAASMIAFEAPVHRMDGASQHLFPKWCEEDAVCLAALADHFCPGGNPGLGCGEAVIVLISRRDVP